MQYESTTGLYLRISADREGRELGVVRQEEDGRALAQRLKSRIYRVYKDNDIGASTRSKKPRPDYKQLIADAKAGRIDTIIAYTSGRLTRRPREHEDLIELAEKYGIKFYYVASPSFDLNTSAGRRVARILAANDAGEAEDIAERVARAKKANAKAGKYLGGYRAYGYEGPIKNSKGEITNRGRINVALVDAEVKVYLECVDRVIAGERPSTVARDLNERGIQSPAGKQWTVGNMKRILLKKRYVIFDDADPEKRGTLEHDGNEYQAVWAGLITRTQYELMMSRLNDIAQKWDHGMIHGRAYLLSGILFCGQCDGPMTGSRRDASHGNARRYRCRSHDSHYNRIGCGKVFRGADPLELYITEAVLARFDTPEVARALAGGSDDSDITELATKLAALQQRRKQLVSEYGLGVHELKDYKTMLGVCDSAIQAVQREIAEQHSSSTAQSLPPLAELRSAWDSASIDWQQSVMKLVVEKVIAKPGRSGKVRYKDRWRFDPSLIEIVWQDVSMSDVAASLSIAVKVVRGSGLVEAA